MFTINMRWSDAIPQSLNRYSYVQNDPVNFTDPSGLNMISPGYQPPDDLSGTGFMSPGIHSWDVYTTTGFNAGDGWTFWTRGPYTMTSYIGGVGGGGSSGGDGGSGGGDNPSLSFEDNYDLIASELRRNQQSRCDRLRRTIEGNAREIERTFNNYDPVSDSVPHLHRWGGSTQPGGHYANFNRFQNSLRDQIAEYKRDCKDRDGSGYDPSPHERWFGVELRPPYSPWERFNHNLRRIWDSIPSLEEQEIIRRRHPQFFPPLIPLPGRVPR